MQSDSNQVLLMPAQFDPGQVHSEPESTGSRSIKVNGLSQYQGLTISENGSKPNLVVSNSKWTSSLALEQKMKTSSWVS